MWTGPFSPPTPAGLLHQSILIQIFWDPLENPVVFRKMWGWESLWPLPAVALVT